MKKVFKTPKVLNHLLTFFLMFMLNSQVYSQTVLLDYGDAPSSYGEFCIRVSSGTPANLGTKIDGESSTSTGNNAMGDDNSGIDDEDGVIFVGGNSLSLNNSKNIELSWQTEDNDSFINGWIDYNQNGVFDIGTNEHVIDDYRVGKCCGSADGKVSITVPGSALCGQTFARFYIHSDANILPTYCSNAHDGEVEDYAITVTGCNGSDCEITGYSIDNLTCDNNGTPDICLLYTSPSPRDATLSRMPSSA